ncbi:hypothetical protein, partial [Porphyromonas sp. COT-290 OH3588]|uniref:hypothetical protein n=1 Tax=Porphyromonas sp. COT-290 OH3588 TaxID=1515617 RepID=UPI001F22FBBF
FGWFSCHVDTVNYILKIVIIRDIYNVSNRKEAECHATVSIWRIRCRRAFSLIGLLVPNKE